jgi:hypothetical protein
MRCAQPAELAELLDVQDAHRCAGQLHAARARRAWLQALVERGPMSNGKGSTRRPKAVSDAELDARWELAFGGWQRHAEHVLMRDEQPPAARSARPHARSFMAQSGIQALDP